MAAAVAGQSALVVQATGPFTSITAAKPAGVADGDLLVAYLTDQGSTQASDFSLAGWTRVGPAFIASSANTRVTSVFYRAIPSAAAETATSYTFASPSSTNRRSALIYRLTGVDPTTPVGASSAAYGFTTVAQTTATWATPTAGQAGLLMQFSQGQFSSPNVSTLTSLSPASTQLDYNTNPVGGTTAVSRTTTGTWAAHVASGAAGVTETITYGGSAASSAGFAVLFNDAPTTFAGSGSLTLTLTATGSGTPTVAGSGSASVALSAAGAGAPRPAGSGSATVTLSTAGAGVPTIAGSGTVTAALSVSGSGSPVVAGSGSLTLALTAAGNGAKTIGGTGALTLTLTAAGSGTPTPTGSGALAVQLDIIGSGEPTVTGTGGVALLLLLDGDGAAVLPGSGALAPLLLLFEQDRPPAPPAQADFRVADSPWQLRVDDSPWQFRTEHSLFRFELEARMAVRADSVEYVYGTWTGAVPLDFDAPLGGFASDQDGDPQLMVPMQWVSPVGLTRTAALLVGPGTEVGSLPRARWWLVGALSAGVESPRKCGGYIDVV
jgi:hypothetical protein